MVFNRFILFSLLLFPIVVVADIYKCPTADGFKWTDMPCDEAAPFKTPQKAAPSAALNAKPIAPPSPSVAQGAAPGAPPALTPSDAAANAAIAAGHAVLDKANETLRELKARQDEAMREELDLRDRERIAERDRKREEERLARIREELKKKVVEKIVSEAEITVGSCLTIGTPDTKWIDTEGRYFTIAWMVDIRNKCERGFVVRVTFKFLDDEGFLVEEDMKFNVHVKPYGLAEVYDSHMIRFDIAKKISKTSVHIKG